MINTLKNKYLIQAFIGISTALILTSFILPAVHAGSAWRGDKCSVESKADISNAFEVGDYNAYVKAFEEIGREPISEEEFNSHIEKIENKKAVHQAIIDNNYDEYLTLTEGSIRQMSESAFAKKVEKIGIHENLRTALKDRDFVAFVTAKEELKTLIGDRKFRKGGDRDREELTEEKFNKLADRFEEYGDSKLFHKRGFHSKKERGCGHSKSKGKKAL